MDRKSDDAAEMMTQMQHLGKCWEQLVVLLKASERKQEVCLRPLQDLCKKLSHQKRIYCAWLEADGAAARGGSTSPLLTAWAELLESLGEACALCAGQAGTAAAEKFHQAISWLMHGFRWQKLPRFWFGCRLSLRFLGVRPIDLKQEEETLTVAWLLDESHDFVSLFDQCEANYSKLSWPGSNRRARFSGKLREGQVVVDVDSSIVFGLRLRRYGPSGDMLEMEVPPFAGPCRSGRRRLFCPVPSLCSAAICLQLFLSVDMASSKGTSTCSLSSGSTGLQESSLQRRVNMIPVSKPVELHFTVT
ncbi:unnamed protein product [Durusdinium trenchii]|uniref:Anaphase-promoting complex subunit 1 n=2 Tax=Durusdinium trenchii TaxID=1381693 RepID=A0ABP0I4S5_9DINO